MTIIDRARDKERIRKLPKWAQDIIAQQAGTIESLRKDLRAVFSERETEASFESYGLDSPQAMPARLYLPQGMVTFHLGRDRYGREHDMRISVERNLDGQRSIRINGMVGPIYVEPQASNVVAITSLRTSHLDED